jgi:quercetin dioxygenase-like cupin family protein
MPKLRRIEMHLVGKFNEAALTTLSIYENHSMGYTQTNLVDHTCGSVHTGLSVAQLAAGGTLAWHVHSFEESFYILAGQVVVSINEQAHLLRPGDYGVVKVGTPHAWRNIGSTPARWLQMAAPQPKPPGKERDTFFAKRGEIPNEAEPLDPDDPKGNLLGHIEVSEVPSSSEGRTLKWLIDEKLGACHHRLAFIEYQPGASLALHDHTFEESYFMLSGEAEAIMDGERYLVKPGDVLWTGVGCVHAFANIGDQPVSWLETFSPQPPDENFFRFMAEWEQRAKELEV